MPFIKTTLANSWIDQLPSGEENIGRAILNSKVAPAWACALDEERKTLFLQLSGASTDARDGIYFYLLAIGSDMILIQWDNGTARVLNRGAAEKYPRSFLEELADEAAVVACHDNKPLFFQAAT